MKEKYLSSQYFSLLVSNKIHLVSAGVSAVLMEVIFSYHISLYVYKGSNFAASLELSWHVGGMRYRLFLQ